MSLLQLDDVDAFYGRLQALRSLTIEVGEGEMVGILGPNGAGKTTTLRAISGLVRTTGRIELRGRDLTHLAADAIARAGIAHVPEGRGTFPQLSTRENLAVSAAARLRGRRAVRSAVDEVLTYLPQLADHLDRPAGLLSGGQQQLLAIGRGLLSKPSLLMVDEPTLGLAPKLAQELVAHLRRLQQEVGFSVLLVEQNAALALGATDRVYVLDNGEAVEAASASALNVEGLSRRYLGTSAASSSGH